MVPCSLAEFSDLDVISIDCLIMNEINRYCLLIVQAERAAGPSVPSKRLNFARMMLIKEQQLVLQWVLC